MSKCRNSSRAVRLGKTRFFNLSDLFLDKLSAMGSDSSGLPIMERKCAKQEH